MSPYRPREGQTILSSASFDFKVKKPFGTVQKGLKLSALVGIRTPNLLIRSEMLYPIELQVRYSFMNIRFLRTAKIGFLFNQSHFF